MQFNLKLQNDFKNNIRREWALTNGLGGYAGGSVTGTFLVFSVTGSFKLPPAGDTVPIKVIEPVSPLFRCTYPARP